MVSAPGKPDSFGLWRALPALIALALPGSAFEAAAGSPVPEMGAKQKATTSQAIEFFEKKVRPLLAEKCFQCHSGATGVMMGRLRLDARAALLKGGAHGPAIVPAHPERSLILRAVSYRDSKLQMPPAGPLAAAEVEALTAWIKMGAPWPESTGTAPAAGVFDLRARAGHWAYKPLQSAPVPAVRNGAWPRNPVDSFLLAKMEAGGLAPARPADRPALIRRVTYDLIGLPPTPTEIDAFVRDTAADAYEKLVERLLASPHYGERWARHWLDLVRYAETDGHEFDFEKPNAYLYRDYVIRSLNADLPYDRFVLEHLAGDVLPDPRRNPTDGANESILATGFYWLGEGKHSPVDLLEDEAERVDNQIDVFGKTFLGLTVGCARCHDHKFDAISTRDYYALSGFLKSTRYQLTSVTPPEKLAEGVRALRAVNARLHPLVVRQWNQALQARPGRVREMLQAVRAAPAGRPADGFTELYNAAVNSPADPLYPWVALADAGPAMFAARRAQLSERLRALAREAGGLPTDAAVFADFRKENYQNWFLSGTAFGQTPNRLASPRCAPERPDRVVGVRAPGAADSGALGEKLQGALRSKTFMISRRYILYRLSGRGGNVRLIIDNFQRIRDPIYGRLAFDVNTEGRLKWFTQDVGKWVGHRAYIEITDPGPGEIAVQQILFSEQRAPADAPNLPALRILEDPGITSREQLAARYAELLLGTAQSWADGQPGGAEDEGQAAVIDALCRLVAAESDSVRPAQAVLPVELAGLLEENRRLEGALTSAPLAMAACEGTPEDDRVHVRGSCKNLGDPVPRRFLEVLAGPRPPEGMEGTGRLTLARQMVGPCNPLLARVMVNRLWQHHFGEGIVRTPDDFGVRCDKPTHPELLEFLASEFIRQRWSLKAMHRLIVLSNAYRMSSKPEGAAEQRDPQNRLLSHMPVRRLEAEAIRDAILAVSGRLDRTLYGPGVLPYLTPFQEGRGRPTGSGPLDGNGRRSIYIQVRRNFLTPLFTAFDFPTPFSTMGRRTVSNVPAQALTLLNDPFVIQQSRLWAAHVLAEPAGPDERIERLYRTALAREPSTAERKEARDFLQTQNGLYGGSNAIAAWADLCHVLYNAKEFVFIP